MIFLCRNGHMHREQWLADNCRRCKAAERRRLARAAENSYSKGVREMNRKRVP